METVEVRSFERLPTLYVADAAERGLKGLHQQPLIVSRVAIYMYMLAGRIQV